MSKETVQPPAVTVASVPGAHPYVEHLLDPADRSVVHLVDPPSVGDEPGRWWPPAMLTARWIEAHAADFDVLHVHFGMESFDAAVLTDALDALERMSRPLVYTLHDLINPQLVDQTRHDEQVATMVRRAAEIVTLTPGAASEIASRWGRDATVVAHPHIVPLERSSVLAAASDGPTVVGVHLRDLRPNIAAAEVVDALALALDILRARGIDVEVRVDLNVRVRDERARDEVRRVASATPGMTLRERDRLDDVDLERTVSEADVALLPYRHGTHSGWVELCFDLAVPVIGPDIGYLREQHPEDYTVTDIADPRSLAAAIVSVISGHARAGSVERRRLIEERREARREERRTIAREHRAVYERAIG